MLFSHLGKGVKQHIHSLFAVEQTNGNKAEPSVLRRSMASVFEKPPVRQIGNDLHLFPAQRLYGVFQPFPYRDHGIRVHYVEEQRTDKPNALFMRDLCFMTPEGAIVTRPAMEARRGEEKAVAKALANLGVPIVRTITGSATFEGAMCMWIDRKTVVLASGVRTNREGYEMMEYELRRMGVTEILHMQIPYGHAHIDGNLNFASHEVAAIHPAQVPYDVCDALKKKGFKLIECPSRLEAKETFGINFVAIKPGLIVMPAGNERLQELLEQNGIEVIAVELDEIMKGYGAIHCCTAFLKRESN